MAFRQFTITLKRFTEGKKDHGRYTAGMPSTSSIVVGVQQPTPDDLELLPEGKRTGKTIVLFSTTAFQLSTVTDDFQTIDADQVLIENEWFEVAHVKQFRTLFPGNYKAICTKIENPDDLPVATE